MKKSILTGCLLALICTPVVADEKTDLAVQMIAAGGFVNEYCPMMKTNILLMSAVVTKLGVSIDTIQKNTGKMVQGQLYVETLKSDTKASCESLWSMFGSDGTVISGLFQRK